MLLSMRELISRELDIMTTEKPKAEQVGLELEVLGKAIKEYIDHFAFLLEPHIGKLPAEVILEMQARLGECYVEVEPKSHNAPKVVPSSGDKETISNGAELGNLGELEGGERSLVF